MSSRIILMGAFALCISAICNVGLDAQSRDSSTPQIDLTQENLDAWRQHILPAKSELDWQDEIAWFTTFSEGVLEADKSDRPLLLWVMNGHPMGCT